MRPAQTQPLCLLHRVGDDLYLAVDAGEARRLTGNYQFDTFGLDKLFGGYQRDPQPPGIVELAKHKELFDLTCGQNRLYLVYFKQKDHG